MSLLLERIAGLRIRTKIALTLFVVIALLSLGIGFTIRKMLTENINRTIEHSIRTIIQVEEDTVLKNLLEGNDWEIFKIMNALKNTDLIREATFVDAHDRVIASSAPERFPIGYRFSRGALDKEGVMILPLKSRDRVFGYFLLRKEHTLIDTLIRNLKVHLLLALLAAALLSALVGYLISNRIVTRLERLSRYAGKIQSQEWKDIVEVKTFEKDEISELSDTFTSMARQIEAMIREEEETKLFYHNILESLDALILICNANLKLVYHNSNRLGQCILEEDRIREAYKEAIKIRLLNGEKRFVLDARDQDGKPLYLYVTVEEIGRSRVFFFTDITSVKKMEEQILIKNAFEIVGEISAEVVHEIKNYLQPIRILLEQDQVDGEDRERMLVILQKVNRMVLDFLKRGASVDQGMLERIDLKNRIESVLFLFSRQLSEKSIRLHKHMLPSLTVEMSPLDFDSIVMNLLSNALEACNEGGEIRIDSREEAGYAVLTVSNTGQRIDPSILEKIRRPFFTTKKSGGGIGLYMIYKFVYLYGGYIEIEGDEKGTTFHVHLPKGGNA